MILTPKVCSVSMCDRSVLVTCDCHNQHFCNDHFVEHTAKPDPPVDGATSDASPSQNLPLNKRSCFNTFNQWWRHLYQRVRHSSAENTEQKVEASVHQEVQLDQLTVPVIPAKQESKAAKKRHSKIMRQTLFPFQPPYHSVQAVDKNSVSMGCSGKHLLIEQKPNLCMFDRNLTVVKQFPWSYNHVNVCWASTLGQFILVTHKEIFTLDESTLELQAQSVPHHNKKDWSGAACSDTALYLSTMDMSASLYEYTLLPSIQFVQERHLSVMCPLYESILTFTYGNDRLALLICNAHTFENRLELHAATTFENLWTVPLNMLARCCSIGNDEWIVVNYLEAQLLHISSNGQILQDFKDTASLANPIINAIQWDKETIVTATIKTLRLHKLPK